MRVTLARWRPLAGLLVLGCLLLGPAAFAAPASAALDVAVFHSDEAVPLERLRSPAEAVRFVDALDGRVRLHTAAGERTWIRIRGEAAADSVLRLPRAAVERVTLYLPRHAAAPQAADGFFRPPADTPLFRSHFVFELPPGAFEAFVAVQSRARVQLVPELVDAGEHRRDERALGLQAAAAYAAVLVTALSSLALFVALRERYLLWFALFCASGCLMLGALAGHLYQLPGAGMLAALGLPGLLALALLATAAGVVFTARFVGDEVGITPRLRPDAIAVALAALALLGVTGVVPALLLQFGVFAVLLATLGGATLVCAARWRRGEPLALPVGLLWLLLAWAAGLRMLVSSGAIAPGFWSMHGYLLVLAIGLVLMSMVLAARVLEFRRRHEHVHRLHVQTDADLQREQRRRQFGEALRESLRNAGAPGDLEWRAFKQLAQTVSSLVPNRAIAISATGYRGFDFLLTEPLSAKSRYCQLLAARGITLKGIARSRSPVQLTLELKAADADADAPAELAQFAVVPMSIARPGWGVLLVERDGEQAFDADELAQVAEFVELALAAADEGAQRAELRRTADVDPLTGVLNRRAGEQRFEPAFNRCLRERVPFTVVLADLDHFKEINDRHGHPVGDECLRAVADAMRPQLGSEDLLLRYGGEEFVIVLPGREAEDARVLAERIRSQVAGLRIVHDDAVIKLTISLGVAARLPSDERAQQVIERAERAMHAAKRGGRNRVELALAAGPQVPLPPLY